MYDPTYRSSSASLFFEQLTPSSLPDLSSRDGIFLQKVRSYIISNISNPHFGVDTLAASVYLSISQLNRRLKLLIGRPAGQFIRELRLSSAASQLAYTNKAIGEVAIRTGFSDQAHFCRSFKKSFQCTPSRFRQQYRLESQEAFFSSINARIWQKNAQ